MELHLLKQETQQVTLIIVCLWRTEFLWRKLVANINYIQNRNMGDYGNHTKVIFPASWQIGRGSETLPNIACGQRGTRAEGGWPREDDKYSEVTSGEQHTSDCAAGPDHQYPSSGEQLSQPPAKPTQAECAATQGMEHWRTWLKLTETVYFMSCPFAESEWNRAVQDRFGCSRAGAAAATRLCGWTCQTCARTTSGEAAAYQPTRAPKNRVFLSKK